MKIRIRNLNISVTGHKVKKVVQSFLFQRWLNSLSSKFILHFIEIQSVDTVKRKVGERVLFIKLKAKITDEFGRALPGIIFLRGASVGVLILLRTPKGTYVVLVQSSMPAIGKVFYPQLPAGMMDEETEPMNVAIREMSEETGLSAEKGKMTCLTKNFFRGTFEGMYPSPGASDEIIHLFLYEQDMIEEEVELLRDKKTGIIAENEHIVLKIVTLDQLCFLTPDVKAHSAYLIYKIAHQKSNERFYEHE